MHPSSKAAKDGKLRCDSAKIAQRISEFIGFPYRTSEGIRAGTWAILKQPHWKTCTAREDGLPVVV